MDLIQQGLFLMLIGMGSVFSFLIIMLFSMNVCSKILLILNKYVPEINEEVKNKKQKSDTEAEIAIAIACANKRAKAVKL